MPEWFVPALLVLIALLVLWLVLRRPDTWPTERLERELRDEIARQAQASRADLGSLQQVLLTQSGDVARTQNEQIDAFRLQLQTMQQQSDASLHRLSDVLAEQLRLLGETNERRQAEMRQAVEVRLQSLQDGNEKKLEQMRATVDEKLQSTLEQRLGESFKLVADRLEQVHKGLGEMQGLARDVGSLNRVLINVKTRGVFGEVQLAALLEQVFTPEQYARNVETVPGSRERVEFAIRFPGRREDGAPLWLPIDAKFPREDYERLLEAQERADPVAMEAAANAIESRLRTEARTIRTKYICAPHTTDFAILFVPTEGLYAEALRRPGLVQALQTEHRIMLAGPTTLLATLNSLQMGFRTLAIERRSAEVWQVLGAVKTEFAKFGDVLASTKKKLAEASKTIDAAETRTRAMARQLKGVEALPDPRVRDLFQSDELPEGDAPGL
ncbi:MAG TPA: DNA recombination protein RmuC [Burkholderiaceae bacterium]|nr:DNA recombination protein RmuC [Burkholderiaceae bacterium]